MPKLAPSQLLSAFGLPRTGTQQPTPAPQPPPTYQPPQSATQKSTSWWGRSFGQRNTNPPPNVHPSVCFPGFI